MLVRKQGGGGEDESSAQIHTQNDYSAKNSGGNSRTKATMHEPSQCSPATYVPVLSVRTGGATATLNSHARARACAKCGTCVGHGDQYYSKHFHGRYGSRLLIMKDQSGVLVRKTVRLSLLQNKNSCPTWLMTTSGFRTIQLISAHCTLSRP